MELKLFSFFLLIAKILTEEICSNDDIKKLFFPCVNGSRDVITYKNSSCLINKENQHLLGTTIRDLPCDLKCDNGYKLDLDIIEKKLQCVKCPKNTYSEGGNIIIEGSYQEWTPAVFSLFNSKCYINDDSGDFIPGKCEGFNIYDDGESIRSGSTNLEDVRVSVDLLFGTNLKNKGKIEFKYKKDTIADVYLSNGELKFFLDYQIKVQDDEQDSSWKSYSFDLEPGYHNFLWVYTYTVDPNNLVTKNLKATIESIKIYGIDDAAYECKKCLTGWSKEGDTECHQCKFSEYIDTISYTCKKCDNNKFSYPNSVGNESCMEKLACSDYDYNVKSIDTCQLKSRKITYDWNQPSLCDKDLNSSVQLPNDTFIGCDKCEDGFELDSTAEKNNCKECPLGLYSNADTNFTCRECEDGTYAQTFYLLNTFTDIIDDILLGENLHFNNTCQSNQKGVCEHINGWKFHMDNIITGRFLPNNHYIELKLSKNFKILENQGVIGINFSVEKLTPEEYIHIKLDGKNMDSYNDIKKHTNYYINYHLEKGDHILDIIYVRNKNCSNTENAAYISEIKMIGTNIGTASKCSKCPEGSIREKFSKNHLCTKCPVGYTSNAEKTECVKCGENLIWDENDGTCVKCPNFTALLNQNETVIEHCSLYDIIENKEAKLRFNLKHLKKEVSNMCDSDDEICYNEKFMGPITESRRIITDSKTEKKISERKAIYFFSAFSPDNINLTDFTYEQSINDFKSGNIFALLENEQKVTGVKHKITGTHHVTTKNVKVLKNLGRKIHSVKIINSSSLKNERVNNGIVVSYDKGDTCLTDRSRRYKTYLYLKCDKTWSSKTPILLAKLENNCTYIFEWRSNNVCPSCVKSNIKKEYTSCINNTRTAFFVEDETCRIFNITDKTLLGYNTSIDKDSLLNDKDDYIIKQFFDLIYRNLNEEDHETTTKIANVKASIVNKTNNDYAEQFSENETCSLIDTLDEQTYIVLICVPIIYLLTAVLCLCFYCKYKKVRIDYETLRQTAEEPGNEIRQRDIKLEI